MRHPYSPGSRKPIEGAPFAQWWILSGDAPLNGAPSVWEYPDDDVDEGRAQRFIGDIHIDPNDGRIRYRAARRASWGDTNALLEWARTHRNDGTIAHGIHPDELTVPLTIPLYTHRDVVRCRVDGCEHYRRWHDAARLVHTVCDMSKPEYTCRIIWADGEWRPDVAIRVTRDPQTLRAFTSDVQWVLTELNQLVST